MKNFELEQMGIQEMDAVEVKNTDGGGWLADLIEKALCSCNGGYSTSDMQMHFI